MTERTYLRGRVMRVTRLDGCGNPILGPDSVVVSDGFVSITLTPNVVTGEAIQLDNAWGERKVDDVPTPRFVNYTEEYQFIGVNPELLAIMTGMPVEMNAAGDDVVGFRINSEVNVDLLAFAVEFWTGVSGDVCDEDQDQLWGYGLLPFNKGGTIGAVTVANAAINFSVTGAQSKKGSLWGVGPHDVVEDETGEAGPLNSPITIGDHQVMITTSVPPPDATNGEPMALGTADLTATAAINGQPGAGQYYPAGLTGVTASPTSAWTAGQYVKDYTGAKYHWSGTAWVAGPA